MNNTKTNKIWAIGGGKGGTGKTLLVANMGVYLSKLGEKVLLIDDDLMGANLHTCLGVDPPPVSLNDFFSGKIDSIENAIYDTGYKNLKLISRASDPITAGNFGPQDKSKLIKATKSLDFNYILFDLGSGLSIDVLDTFRNADYGIFVVIPEPTAIENAYRFLRGLIFYQIRKATMTKPI